MKTYILFFSLLIIAGLVYYFGFSRKETSSSGLANPAAVNCQKQGGSLNSLEFEKGTKAFCSFEDGSECEEWAFYRDECRKGELKKEVLRSGSGEMADAGDTVAVHYTGTLLDGKKFDSSLDRGVLFSFVLGSGQVIQGWEQGVLGMQVGEKRKLTIAPRLAYGDREISIIPASSTLVF